MPKKLSLGRTGSKHRNKSKAADKETVEKEEEDVKPRELSFEEDLVADGDRLPRHHVMVAVVCEESEQRQGVVAEGYT